MTLKGWLPLFGATLLALAQTGRSQHASNWRVFKAADGLPESACVSVTVSPGGKILVRHPRAPWVSELDGYSINAVPAPTQGGGRIYASPAGQLWTAVPQGLMEFKEGAWVLRPVPEIALHFRTGPARLADPAPLLPVRQGRVLFLLPDRLAEYNIENPDRSRSEGIRATDQARIGEFTGMIAARDGGLWIAGTRGLAKVPGPARTLGAQSEWREFVPPTALSIGNFRALNEDQEEGVTMVAESSDDRQEVIVHTDGERWTTQPVGTEKLLGAWRGPDKHVWAASIESLWQLNEQSSTLVASEEVSARRYFDVAVEPGGAFWLATSDGLFRHAPRIWSSPRPVQELNVPVHCLAEDSRGRFWFAAASGLHVLEENLHREYPLPRLTGRSMQTRALFPLKDGTLLLDDGEQLLQFRPDNGLFQPVSHADGVSRCNVLGLLKDGTVCVQSYRSGAAGIDYRLEFFDGSGFQRLPLPGPDLDGAFKTSFAAQNGDLWLGGEQGIAWFHDKRWRTFPSTDKAFPEVALGFAELPDGKIWCATADKIWEFDGRNWSALRSRFDGVNALLRTRDGSVWVASNNGLHWFHQGAWIEHGTEEGLPNAAVRQIHEDQRGRVWAGTARGLCLYHPEADPDPPRISIQPITNTVSEGGSLILTFTGQDKWKQTPGDRLLYSHRLDGRDWSPFQGAAGVTLADLPAGKHYFQVRSMDCNGNIPPQPASLEFAVALPWYKETRLVVIAFGGMAVALFFAGLAFNRHRQLLRSYAQVEEKVAQRTRELEMAHRELLHSQKMNALGALAAGIAHDFNNILSIVKGSAQIIESSLDDPRKIRTRVDRIKTVVEQGSGIVKAMLGFSSSNQEPGRCDLNAVVDDTIKLLGDRFLREAEARFERTPDLPAVPGAKDLIQQVLLNFIFNAAESMAGRKQVIVSTRRINELPAGMVLAPATAAAYVSVSVQDFGCGILPENLPRIFEPFFTTKSLSTKRGTGLGLSMAYELARKMEAGLAVESTVGQGSMFTLILPVRDLLEPATA